MTTLPEGGLGGKATNLSIAEGHLIDRQKPR